MLPEEFRQIVLNGTLKEFEEMMLRCLPNAVGNYNKYNAFGFESIGEEAARWLLDYGTDINMPDRFGYTPMHLGGICPVGIAKSHAYPLEKTDYRR